MIHFRNVKKSFGESVVLKDLSFKIKKGEFAVLIGPSGCGKTTTLKMINRLIEPNAGEIFINGQDTSTVNRVQLRRSIGYVIQQIGLFPNMTVAQNICVVPKLLQYDKAKCNDITHQLLELVNMPYDEYANKYPSELSGGQQQRVGVLRALAASPPIVLMDEPFGALDPMTRNVLQDEIARLHKKLEKTIVFVTHDMDEALKLADKIVFMDAGEIVQIASPEEMLANPANDLISSFMGGHVQNKGSLTAADFMRTDVVTVHKKRGPRECTNLMARHDIDLLIVKNEDDTYAGIVSIDALRRSKNTVSTIEGLIAQENCVSNIDEDAQACFEKLEASGDHFVVVLNPDNTVAGIVTKTSMARAMADVLWGEA